MYFQRQAREKWLKSPNKIEREINQGLACFMYAIVVSICSGVDRWYEYQIKITPMSSGTTFLRILMIVDFKSSG